MSEVFKKALEQKIAELVKERERQEKEEASGGAPAVPDITLNWGDKDKPTQH